MHSLSVLALCFCLCLLACSVLPALCLELLLLPWAFRSPLRPASVIYDIQLQFEVFLVVVLVLFFVIILLAKASSVGYIDKHTACPIHQDLPLRVSGNNERH